MYDYRKTVGDKEQSAAVSDQRDDCHLTPVEVAELLSVPVNTIYFWTAQKRIPHFRFGPRTIRYSSRAIREWMHQSAIATATEATVEE
jgi:excisionase family DNA binding protein